jgi:hypothetical protein
MPDYAEWMLDDDEENIILQNADGDEVGKVNIKNLLEKAGWKKVG